MNIFSFLVIVHVIFFFFFTTAYLIMEETKLEHRTAMLSYQTKLPGF